MPNKKSQLEDWIPTLLIIAALVISLSLLLIPNTVKTKKIEEQFEFQSLDIDSEQFLITYLQLPLELELNKKGNIADAIQLYLFNRDEELIKKITSKTNEFFTKTSLQTDRFSWMLEIKYPDKKGVTIDSEGVHGPPRARVYFDLKREVAKTIIPAINGQSIEIRLFYVATK